MRVSDLASKQVAIWGLGREGQAALRFIRSHHPDLRVTVIDDALDAVCPDDPLVECCFGPEKIARVLDRIDIIVKSPGVGLYLPVIAAARERGIVVTSLMNLWLAQPHEFTTICVTGSKGKSTTASLIAHALRALGSSVDLVGNVGVPVTEAKARDYVVMEVSSYQAADFAEPCDVGVLTSLHPEHLDWHGSLDQYYKDKSNLLAHSKIGIVNAQAMGELTRIIGAPAVARFRQFNTTDGLRFSGSDLYKGEQKIGSMANTYLQRQHNMSNLCAMLTVVDELKLDLRKALVGVEDFHGLPHRQQELGALDGVTYVDDSISTTAESAMAALAAYVGRDITIIVGGFDRQIDYGKLVEKLAGGAARTVICFGESGARIQAALCNALEHRKGHACDIYRASTMSDAVAHAKMATPQGGVVLLSPAAPSYGYYANFIERGRDFAAKVGLPNPFYPTS
jgi:UDP-N-acetylmuramoylalanine--D-glutamate ligase